MNVNQRIIDRDIQFYETVLENHQDHLYRCAPSQEESVRKRITAATALLVAMKEYRHSLDDL